MLQLLPLEDFRQRNFVADFKLFLGKLGVMHDLGWWLIGKPTVDFLFALTELSSLSVMVPEL